MKNKKGSIAIYLLIIGVFVLISIAGYAVWKFSSPAQQSTINPNTQETINQITQASSEGKAASLKLWVRDDAQDTDTKAAVPIYCVDDATGTFLADAKTSSTSDTTTVSVVTGQYVTCYAFNSTFITKAPLKVHIDAESVTKVIEGYTVKSGVGKIDFYRDNAATSGQNVSLSGTNSQDHFQKLRFTVNGSNSVFPLAGFYLDTVSSSNVSDIDMSGKVTLFNNAKDSSSLIKNTNVNTNVGARKDKMNYVFTVGQADANGNNVILLEQNDYAETGTVNVKSSTGCIANGELVNSYAMGAGYYKAADGSKISFGTETDASPATITVGSSDINAGNSGFYCASYAI